MSTFRLKAPYLPKGDQPAAIDSLVKNIQEGVKSQTLLGVTGSGKTYTMANVIHKINKPTLIMSHNKTLAAQLYSEFKTFFPENAVEYFISYYDYYQPEAYMPKTNVYIEKDMSINEEIEKMRLKTASSLLSGRRDVIVVSSVACIYGMANPVQFGQNVLTFKVGDTIIQKEFLLSLVRLLYNRDENKFTSGTFRVRGDTVDVFLAYTNYAYRFFFFGDEIESIYRLDPATGKHIVAEQLVTIFPANLFVTSKEVITEVMNEIRVDLAKQVAFFKSQNRNQEATRIQERTHLDLEMLEELGYCSGIENYSRYFDRRQPGQQPFTLLNYFPKDYLLLIDESHVTLPQVRAMWGGDHARKKHLVDFGFRLPAAIDNRPLHFREFENMINQVIFVSATPADYELECSQGVVVEQVVRPTGLIDPKVTIQPTKHQIDHLLTAIRKCVARDERVLVTTLTKHMAEELSKYLIGAGVACGYLHSEIKTLERVAILEDLRGGKFDVLVGVNLLREGLDLPEVSLVAILDADKEGFLRNTRSLIQTIGRAARHVEGRVILYADRVTDSMSRAMDETSRRRSKQLAYNGVHGIVPTPIQKCKKILISDSQYLHNNAYEVDDMLPTGMVVEGGVAYGSVGELKKRLGVIRVKMAKASDHMDYITAQRLKEELEALEKQLANLLS